MTWVLGRKWSMFCTNAEEELGGPSGASELVTTVFSFHERDFNKFNKCIILFLKCINYKFINYKWSPYLKQWLCLFHCWQGDLSQGTTKAPGRKSWQVYTPGSARGVGNNGKGGCSRGLGQPQRWTDMQSSVWALRKVSTPGALAQGSGFFHPARETSLWYFTLGRIYGTVYRTVQGLKTVFVCLTVDETLKWFLFNCLKQYHHLKNISVGTLGYGENEDNDIGLKVCKQQYKRGTLFPLNETLNIDSDIEKGNAAIYPPTPIRNECPLVLITQMEPPCFLIVFLVEYFPFIFAGIFWAKETWGLDDR